MRSVWAIMITLFLFEGFIPMVNASEGKLLSRKEARLIAEQTKEAESLFGLKNGRFANCIEESVVKSCDSDWVRCVEDAWVVEFKLGDICKVDHDERLALYIIVDAKTGKVISTYPEIKYFAIQNYCEDPPDCLFVSVGQENVCLNFIYGQIDGKKSQAVGQCQCVKNECKVGDTVN